MESLLIKGGVALHGEVQVSGAKNAVLPIMAATLLTDEPCVIRRVPNLSDVTFMGQILSSLGAQVDFPEPGSVRIHAPKHFWRGRLRSDPQNARVDLYSRPAPGPLAQSQSVSAGRVRHRVAPDRFAFERAASAGSESNDPGRLCGRHGRQADGAAIYFWAAGQGRPCWEQRTL